MASKFEVGAAVADMTPPAGVPMGGYGARQGVARGTHDPLLVRAFVIGDARSILALAVCDLVGVSRDLVETARERIATDLRIPTHNVMISATHTHSGPASLRTGDDPDYVKVAARTVAGAVRTAVDVMRPAALALGDIHVESVSQNRRDPEGPIETKGTVLLASDDRGTIATVVNYACHATVLEYDNLLFSADFPGATNRLVERELGGVSLYLQGACGDINPVWLRHDFDEVDRIGGIVGAAAVKRAHELRAVGRTQRVVNLSWGQDVEVATSGTPIEDVYLHGASEIVEVQWREFGRPDDAARQVTELEKELADNPHDRRRIYPKLHRARMEHVFSQAAPPAGKRHKAEVQVLRLSRDVALVGLPGEFFTAVARDVRDRSPFQHTLVSGYANNYLGYFPTAEEFANDGYEVGCARFEPDAAATIADAGVKLLGTLA